MKITNDHFVIENNYMRAGTHIIVDLWQCDDILSDVHYISESLNEAAKATGATVLDSYFHGFAEGEGVTGVILLEESHISIHTWPERHFAAVDIFTCGACKPHRAVDVLGKKFNSLSYRQKIIHRGYQAI